MGSNGRNVSWDEAFFLSVYCIAVHVLHTLYVTKCDASEMTMVLILNFHAKDHLSMNIPYPENNHNVIRLPTVYYFAAIISRFVNI